MTRQGASGTMKLLPMARGLALFLGGLALSSPVARVLGGAPHLERVWIETRPLSQSLVLPLLALCGFLWIAWAIQPLAGRWRRVATMGVTMVAGSVALFNAVVVLALVIKEQIRSPFPMPLSALLAVALGWLGWHVFRSRAGGPSNAERMAPTALAVGSAWAVLMGLFPLLQFATLGITDFRRPASYGVVLGAKTHADGRLSDALRCRVATAIQVYQEGYVRALWMSGGPGEGPVHEVEAMAREAMAAGVPKTDILLDREGLNTQATARNIRERLRQGEKRILVISEYYHLPRIRLAFAREGLEVVTVPASPEGTRRWVPIESLLREIPAYWVYYLRALTPLPARAAPEPLSPA